MNINAFCENSNVTGKHSGSFGSDFYTLSTQFWVEKTVTCYEPLILPRWKTGKAVRWSKQRTNCAPFAVVAIWDQWLDKSTGEIVLSFSMLTINADKHPVIRRFHRPDDEKRSLVIVPPEKWTDWLGATDITARDMLVEMTAAEFEGVPSDNRPAPAQKQVQDSLSHSYLEEN